ncbi:uncharacterized protein LOC143275904 [Babylonia areolata]|uniref:uncharacterized protein LOC143275904 n=1 Tax=Babylonia areolata TaxID=304850 RepID=UPI003FD0D560
MMKAINGRLANSAPCGTRIRRNPRRAASRGLPGQPYRGSIPIHVDGSRDELAEVDPDLTLAELEWRWTGVEDPEAGGEREGVGGLQTKSVYSADGLYCYRLQQGNRASSAQPSRARPIKPHETEPFLAVGDIVRDTRQAPSSGLRPASGHQPGQRRRAAKARPRSACQRSGSPSFSSVVSGRACLTPSSLQDLRRDSSSPSAFSSPTPSLRVHSAGSQGRRSLGRMYVSPIGATPRPNSHVKSPFKHSVRPPTQASCQEPSRDLKERTAMATHQMHRVLTSGRANGAGPKRRGKLQQKGRLMPLYPVAVLGPSISQCRGILADTRTYTPSPSRLLQYRRNIQSGDLHLDESADHLSGGYESMHRVSAASSLEELAGMNRDEEEEEEDFQAEIAALEEEAMREEERMMMNAYHSSPHPPATEQTGTADTAHAGENGTAEAAPQNLTDRGRKADEEAVMDGNSKKEPQHTGGCPSAEVSGQARGGTVPDTTKLSKSTGNKKETLHTSGDRGNKNVGDAPRAGPPTTTLANNNNDSTCPRNDKVLTGNVFKNSNSSSQGDAIKRPQSASVRYSEPAVSSKLPERARPKTAASVKAVRFADLTESSDGTRRSVSRPSCMADGKTARDREEQGRQRKGAGQSCRPTDLHSKQHRDDDDGDGGDGDKGGGGGGAERRRVGRASAGSAASGKRSAGAGEPIRAAPPSSQPQQTDCDDVDNVADVGSRVSAGHRQREAETCDPIRNSGRATRRGGGAVVNPSPSVPGSRRPVKSETSMTASNDTAPVRHVASKPGTASNGTAASTINTASNSNTAKNTHFESVPTSAPSSVASKHSSGTTAPSFSASLIPSSSTAVTTPTVSNASSLVAGVTTPTVSGMSFTAETTPTDCGMTVFHTATDPSLPATPPSSKPWRQESSVPASWQSPPVTWWPSVGEGVLPGSVPDRVNLLKLLLDVSAQVSPPSGQGANSTTSLNSQDTAVHMAGKPVGQHVEREPDQLLMFRHGTSGAEGAGFSSSAEVLSQMLDKDLGGDVLDEERSQTWRTVRDQRSVPRKGREERGNDGVDRSGRETRLNEAQSSSSQVASRRQPSHGPTDSTQQSRWISDSDPSSHSAQGQKVEKRKTVSTVTQADHGRNPRIGVFACQHKDSPRKTGKGATQKEVDTCDNDGDDRVDDDSKDDRGFSQKRGVGDHADTDTTVGLEGSDSRVNPDGVSLSELFTHFSLGQGSFPSPCARDGESQTSHQRHQPQPQAARVGRSASSNGQVTVPGILKKKKAASATETEKIKMQVSLLSGKRQIFTHMSSKPFVFLSEDPASQAVAEQLKYGTSPYLQLLKLPKTRQQTHKSKGETSAMQKARERSLKTTERTKSDDSIYGVKRTKRTKSEDSDCGMRISGRSRHAENMHGGDSTAQPAPRRRRATRVQFADCSVHELDLNYNCRLTEGGPCEGSDAHAMLTPVPDKHKDEDEPRTCENDEGVWRTAEEGDLGAVVRMSLLHHCDHSDTGTEHADRSGVDQVTQDTESPGDDDDSLPTEEGGVAADFVALEAELCAARTQLQQDILLSQTWSAQDDGEGKGCADRFTACQQHFSDFEEDDDGFVYEDDGSSDDNNDVDEKMDGRPDNNTKTQTEDDNNNNNSGDDEVDDDDDNAYSAYYRALLLDYRHKCMTVGEGSLVISDKLTWPMAASSSSSSSSSTTTPADPAKPSRPLSAGAFRTLQERRQARSWAKRSHGHSQSPRLSLSLSRPLSQSDSGWESEQEAEGRGQQRLDRWSSLLSVDGESVSMSRHPADRASSSSPSSPSSSSPSSPSPFSRSSQMQAAAKREGTAEQSRERTDKGKKKGEQQGRSWLVSPGSRPSSGREDHPRFEIKASSIPLPSARPKAAPSGEGPTAPFPPLCFTVNGRPPPGFAFFFAYATYMNADRLSALVHRQVDKRYWAVLFGFELAFNKLGGEGCAEGLPNIVFNPFSSVEGCVVLLTPTELQNLDAFTDAPQHYQRVVVPVWMSDVSGEASEDDDSGLARHCVAAVTYIATNERSVKEGCTPNEFVASQCLKSADLLTPNYRDRLCSLMSAKGSHHAAAALPTDHSSAVPPCEVNAEQTSACGRTVGQVASPCQPQAVVS